MLLTLGIYFVFMWRIHPGLTVACLSVTGALWWVTSFYSRRLRPAYLRNRELSDGLVLLFTETVKGIQTVKGFAAEPVQLRRFEDANRQVSAQQQKLFYDLSIFGPLTQLLSQLSLVILFGTAVGYTCTTDCAGDRAGGVCGSAAAIQRSGRKHLHDRELSPAELHRGQAGV
jgi:ATP-binding cassette subfamily B protein